ncbi:MAG: hypothetical protein IPP29_13785 [Bacteroidetes bacterium]|nr:hypothetical protein [Bacteroidota bacterium]
MKRQLNILLFTPPTKLFNYNHIRARRHLDLDSGSSNANAAGVYGAQGVLSVNNHPPAVYEPCEWKDKQGNFGFIVVFIIHILIYGNLIQLP